MTDPGLVLRVMMKDFIDETKTFLKTLGNDEGPSCKFPGRLRFFIGKNFKPRILISNDYDEETDLNPVSDASSHSTLDFIATKASLLEDFKKLFKHMRDFAPILKNRNANFSIDFLDGEKTRLRICNVTKPDQEWVKSTDIFVNHFSDIMEGLHLLPKGDRIFLVTRDDIRDTNSIEDYSYVVPGQSPEFALAFLSIIRKTGSRKFALPFGNGIVEILDTGKIKADARTILDGIEKQLEKQGNRSK